jgi:hypothetical protein
MAKITFHVVDPRTSIGSLAYFSFVARLKTGELVDCGSSVFVTGDWRTRGVKRLKAQELSNQSEN